MQLSVTLKTFQLGKTYFALMSNANKYRAEKIVLSMCMQSCVCVCVCVFVCRAWGESLFALIQIAVLVLLIQHYRGKTIKGKEGLIHMERISFFII